MSKSTNGTTFRRVGFLGAFAVAVLAMMPAPVAQARAGAPVEVAVDLEK